MSCLVALLVVVAACEPTRDVYDNAGRLRAVTDPDGDTAVYSYDAVGNITGVEGYSSDDLSLIEFSPRRADVGDEVVIQGTGFADQPAGNTVKFDGMPATVNRAGPLELRVTVPAGATSGSITVTTAAGTTTSAADFTVAPNRAPRITGLSAAVAGVGDQVTINGSNFETDPLSNAVLLNDSLYAPVATAQPAQLGIVVPPRGTSGPVSVATPEGAAASTDYLFVPPERFAATAVDFTAQADLEATTAVTLGTAGKVGLVVFDGQAGHRVSLDFADETFQDCGFKGSLVDPSGAEQPFDWCPKVEGPLELTKSGRYTVVVEGVVSAGTVNVTVHDVPPDVHGDLVIDGDPVTVGIQAIGQVAELSFDGDAGQRLSLTMTGTSFGTPDFMVTDLLGPDGSSLDSRSLSGELLGPIDLPADGTYRVRLDRLRPWITTGVTGSVTFRLLEVPPDIHRPITLDGDPETVDIRVPGQNGDLSFTGHTGDRVSVSLTDINFTWALVSLLAPDDTELWSGWIGGFTSEAFFDPEALPADGQYRIVIDPIDGIGAVTAQAFTVPPDITGTVVVGGAPARVTIAAPGQTASYTFTATAGDPLGVFITDFDPGAGFAIWDVSLFAPDGTFLANDGPGEPIRIASLPQSGTYRIVIDPLGTSTGAATLTVRNLPPDITGEIVPGGDPVPIDFTIPGQTATLTFDGTAGQRVSFAVDDSTLVGHDVRILGPDGDEGSPYYGTVGGPYVLPVDGQYRVQVIPYPPTGTGSLLFRLFDTPPDVTGELAHDGTPVPVNLEAPGQAGRLTFQGTANQRVSLAAVDYYGDVTVRAPDDSVILDQQVPGAGTWPLVLPATGTYVVDIAESSLFDPDTFNWLPQSASFRLFDLPPDTGGTIVVDGPSVPINITAPGQTVDLTFAGTADQKVSLFASDRTFPDFSAGVQLVAPDGTSLGRRFLGGMPVNDVLPQTGTYHLVIGQYPGQEPAVGSAMFQMFNVPPDVSGSIAPGGAPVAVHLAVVGQAAELTFSGTAGQRVSLVPSGNTIPTNSALVSVRAPDGSSIVTTFFGYVVGPVTLPADGIYRLRIDQYRAATQMATGDVTLTMFNVPPDVSGGALTPGGSPVTVTLTVPGQAAELTFAGTTGQQLNLELSGTTFPATSAWVRVFKPDGTALASAFPNGVIGPMTLPADGTYNVRVLQRIDSTTGAVGSLTLRLTTATGAAATAAAAVPEEEPQIDERVDLPDPPPLVDPNLAVERVRDAALAQAAPREAGAPPIGAVAGAMAAAEGPEPPQLISRVSGTVLGLDGAGLSGVTVSVEGQQGTTDATGAFVLELRNLASGRHELVVDGSSANTANASYGTFVLGVDVVEGGTVPLAQTVWMPQLDTAHTVTLHYPLTEEVVVTTPAIPDLEVRIPAGSEMRDLAGNLVTEVGITPIPMDKTPFPLPDSATPTRYFTIQPGGATISPGGFTVVQPNAGGDPTGAWFSLYDYSPANGWYVAGTGEVGADGSQIVPHAGVAFNRFTGVVADGVGYMAPPEGPSVGAGGNPVDLATGLFVFSATDLAVPDVLPISLSRSYRPEDDAVRAFGRGSALSFDLRIWTVWPNAEADLILPTGVQLRFQRITPGQGSAGAVFEHTDTPTEFFGSRLTRTESGWDLTLTSGATYEFGLNTPVQALRDTNGNRLVLQRADGNEGWLSRRASGNVTRISSPSGRWVSLSYDDQNRISQAQDHTGRTVSYAYDSESRLQTVTDPAGRQSSYGYDPQGRITTITGPSGVVSLTNAYDTDGRIASQSGADGETVSFTYDTDMSGEVTRTEVTDPRGIVRGVDFDRGYWVRDTAAVGSALEQSTSVERHPVSRQILANIDHAGRRTEFTYDARGNQTSVTVLADTPDAVTTTTTYDPVFHKVASRTDALGRTTTFAYDDNGNQISETGPDGVTVSSTYDDQGRVVSSTDPLGNTTEFAYEHLHRVTATDARGLVTSQFIDAAGRQVASTDATGGESRSTYDVLDRAKTSTDAAGAVTSFDYDTDGNLTSLTDANGHATTYTYDEMGRVLTYTDPLGASGGYDYDPAGNVVASTDRRGVRTTYAYDDLGNLTTTAYGVTESGAESTIDYSYSALGLPSDIDDSAYGTQHFDYDVLDRLSGETSPQGHVTYSYDVAGQLKTLNIAGGPSNTYDYDGAGRLSALTQGSLVVRAHRNAVGQVTALDLPNGVTGAFTYDDFGALTKISYESSGRTLGDIAYGYDRFGRRGTVSGSLVSTPAPPALDSASYDEANRLRARDATDYVYDAAGNLLGDGTNTYTWNARGQLSSISGPMNATFSYDPSGRRASKTVGGMTTSYLYDGANILQENREGES
ncbi:MAG TPA: DUF6531 domain-containing protein, partial [Acidimicrobiales bacterium]